MLYNVKIPEFFILLLCRTMSLFLRDKCKVYRDKGSVCLQLILKYSDIYKNNNKNTIISQNRTEYAKKGKTKC